MKGNIAWARTIHKERKEFLSYFSILHWSACFVIVSYDPADELLQKIAVTYIFVTLPGTKALKVEFVRNDRKNFMWNFPIFKVKLLRKEGDKFTRNVLFGIIVSEIPDAGSSH